MTVEAKPFQPVKFLLTCARGDVKSPDPRRCTRVRGAMADEDGDADLPLNILEDTGARVGVGALGGETDDPALVGGLAQVVTHAGRSLAVQVSGVGDEGD